MEQEPASPGSAKRIEQLEFEALARLVKTRFRLQAGGETLELELCEATPPRRTPAGGAAGEVYESFSLLFLGPVSRLLPQQIYNLESPSAGRVELFLVPIGRDATGIRYEAAFNRLVETR